MDGTVVEANAACVHIMTPSLHYGWGVYEGIRFYKTPNGPAAFRLTAHIERLRRSAKALGMNIPFTDAELVNACKQVVSRSGLTAGYIRPIVFLREGSMSVAAQLEDVRVAIGCWAWSSYLGNSSKRIRVRTSAWTRSSPNALPPSIKSTGGYINASLARLDAIRGGDQEAIMLNAAGRVAEASAANVFMVMGGELVTPPLSEGILAGITRDSIITIAQDMGLTVIERPIAPAELRSASEIMLAGTAIEWVSVGTLDGQILDKTNAIFLEIRARFDLAIEGSLSCREAWAEVMF
ncbi:hypothetical protein BZ163_07125 [Pseudomonas sp. VI4.1]|nr:hypothetical protein BZ163_07125 [Pseudomonas sp. VI4.1]